jgi:hypothetical protein
VLVPPEVANGRHDDDDDDRDDGAGFAGRASIVSRARRANVSTSFFFRWCRSVLFKRLVPSATTARADLPLSAIVCQTSISPVDRPTEPGPAGSDRVSSAIAVAKSNADDYSTDRTG